MGNFVFWGLMSCSMKNVEHDLQLSRHHHTHNQMNADHAASVQRLAAIASVKVQALLATSILLNARKSVGNDGVFSLSFGPFLSLCLANKEKEKDTSKKYGKVVFDMEEGL